MIFFLIVCICLNISVCIYKYVNYPFLTFCCYTCGFFSSTLSIVHLFQRSKLPSWIVSISGFNNNCSGFTLHLHFSQYFLKCLINFSFNIVRYGKVCDDLARNFSLRFPTELCFGKKSWWRAGFKVCRTWTRYTVYLVI